MIPGMKFAALAISPVLGGKPRSVDESEAKAVPGVRQIVQTERFGRGRGGQYLGSEEGSRRAQSRVG